MNKIIWYILSITALSLYSCSKIENEYKCYTVKEGQHYTRIKDRIFQEVGPYIKFTWRVDKSLFFTPPENSGWSKVCGIRDLPIKSTVNSGRISFQPYIINNDICIVIGFYTHNNGGCHSNTILDTIYKDNIKLEFYIIRLPERWKVVYNNIEYSFDAPLIMDKRWYVSSPYIGGCYTAPNDCYFYLKRL